MVEAHKYTEMKYKTDKQIQRGNKTKRAQYMAVPGVESNGVCEGVCEDSLDQLLLLSLSIVIHEREGLQVVLNRERRDRDREMNDE